MRIVSKESLIPGKTSKMVLEAPEIATHARPGHFVMLRMTPNGERIPLTIADTDPERGLITIVYLVVGKSSAVLESLNEGGPFPVFFQKTLVPAGFSDHKGKSL